MPLYLSRVKIITTAKFIDIFFNKVLRYFKNPKGIIFNYSNIFTSKF